MAPTSSRQLYFESQPTQSWWNVSVTTLEKFCSFHTLINQRIRLSWLNILAMSVNFPVSLSTHKVSNSQWLISSCLVLNQSEHYEDKFPQIVTTSSKKMLTEMFILIYYFNFLYNFVSYVNSCRTGEKTEGRRWTDLFSGDQFRKQIHVQVMLIRKMKNLQSHLFDWKVATVDCLWLKHNVTNEYLWLFLCYRLKKPKMQWFLLLVHIERCLELWLIFIY